MKLELNNSNTGCVMLAAFTLLLAAVTPALASAASSADANREVMVRDVTTIEGVRDNLLVGYGLVVGLHGTGDTQQTIFTVQTLANAMQKMGVLISPSSAVVKNVAAVFVTASLPPFARPGAKLDVTVASVGDAHSLDGGQRWQNSESVTDYVARWKRGEVASVEETPANPQEERFFVGLRLMEGVEPTSEERVQYAGQIAELVEAGLLEDTGLRIKLTPRGVLLSNEVFQEFIGSECPAN